MKILVLLHTQKDGTLTKAALESLSAAQELANQTNSSLVAGVIGANAKDAANAVAGSGIASTLYVCHAELTQPRYATDVKALATLVQEVGADLIIAPGTTRFARALPGVAQRTGAVIDTHVVKVDVNADGKLSAQRWFYRQRIISTFTRSAKPWIVLLDAGIYQPFALTPSGVGESREISIDFDATDLRTTVKGIQAPVSSAKTIRPDAALLFVAGAGWSKKQAVEFNNVGCAEELILDFLSKSQASLGSSKSLADLQSEGTETFGFMTHMNQIGQTGSTPRHPKGLATCCHGEEPHAVGWRFISERRAINLDPNCGWAQGKADILYVADAFEVMKKLNQLLA